MRLNLEHRTLFPMVGKGIRQRTIKSPASNMGCRSKFRLYKTPVAVPVIFHHREFSERVSTQFAILLQETVPSVLPTMPSLKGFLCIDIRAGGFPYHRHCMSRPEDRYPLRKTV